MLFVPLFRNDCCGHWTALDSIELSRLRTCGLVAGDRAGIVSTTARSAVVTAPVLTAVESNVFGSYLTGGYLAHVLLKTLTGKTDYPTQQPKNRQCKKIGVRK